MSDKPGFDVFGRRVSFGTAFLVPMVAFFAFHNWDKAHRLNRVCEQISHALDQFWDQVADRSPLGQLTQAQSNLLWTLERARKRCPPSEPDPYED